MKKLYLFAYLIFAIGHAQTFEWVKTPAINLLTNPYNVGYCVAADASGHSYFAGFRDNESPYNDIYGDCWFNKYDADGSILFSQTFTGKCSIFDIACDTSGNVIIAIGWRQSMTIGTETLTTSTDGVEYAVVKFDSNGQKLWHYRPMIGSNPTQFCRAIAVDALGNVYTGHDNFNKSFVTKLSADGVEQFTITNNDAHLISGVSVDSEGNIYGAGSCAESNASFAGVSAPTSLDYNTWVVKYSSTGTFEWVRYVEDITCSRPRLSVRTPDAIYMGSFLFGNYNFGTIAQDGPPNGGSFNDYYITKLNSDGDFQWVRDVPAGVATPGLRNFIDSDANGNVYFAGSTRFAIDWGNGITTTPTSVQDDALILKYGPDGTLLMAKNAGGTFLDRADAIAVAPDGNIFVSGMAKGNVTFGTITNENSSTSTYPWMAKINTGTLSNVSFESNSIRVWPNPVKDKLNISTSGKSITGTIVNVLGQSVKTFKCDGSATVNTDDMPTGFYFVHADADVVRIVKE